MARQANSPWNFDFRNVTRAMDPPAGKFKLQIDGKEVTLDEYQAHQRKLTLARMGKR